MAASLFADVKVYICKTQVCFKWLIATGNARLYADYKCQGHLLFDWEAMRQSVIPDCDGKIPVGSNPDLVCTCVMCRAQPQLAGWTLISKCAALEQQYAHTVRLCLHCGGGGGGETGCGSAGNIGTTSGPGTGGILCTSLDCGVYFERRKLAAEQGAMSTLRDACLEGLGMDDEMDW